MVATAAQFDTEGVEEAVTGQITVVTDPADATLTYAIADGAATDVATVSDTGVITPLKVGTTTVTVTATKGTATDTRDVEITVTEIE